MKKNATLFLLIAGILLHLNASANYKQGITISVKDEPLEAVFKIIQKQSSYSFVYSGDQLKGASKVSVSVVNETLKNVLDQVLKGQQLRYEISNEFVIIKKKVPAAQASIDGDTTAGKPIDITGRVVDEQGKPVAGATVTVRGSGVSTATDGEGAFLIRAEEKGTIFVSSVGYDSKIVRINGDNNLVVKLNVAVQQMKEVVISTGIQKISSERFLGSYSILDSAAYERMAGMNIIDRLDGTVNGVFFNKKNQGAIQVRGISTINSDQSPLIIVDNFPYPFDLNTINPNDVENIVVLKDAAAASIWGTRAGNGVIVITTKKGKYNQQLNFSFQSNLTIQGKPALFKSNSISSSDFVEVEKFLFKNGYYNSILTDINRPIITPVTEILDRIEKGLISETTGLAEIENYKQFDTRNELLKYVYKPRVFQQHTLGLTGGNNVLNYLLSLGYIRTGPAIQNTKGMDQFTINTTTSIRPLKDLEISIGLMLNQTVDRSTTIPQHQSFPYMQLKNGDGSSVASPKGMRQGFIDTAGGGNLLDWHFRLLDEINMANNKNESRIINLNFGITYKFLNWLSAQIKSQLSTSIQNSENIISEESFEARDLINSRTNLTSDIQGIRNPIPFGGIYDVSNSKGITKSIRGQLNLNKSWGNVHQLQGTFGTEASDFVSSGSSNGYYGYNSQLKSFASSIDYYNYFPAYGKDELVQIPVRSKIEPTISNRIVSMFGNVAYSYDNKYSFYASGRRDGANIFGIEANNKWKPLWSVGSGWTISNERFFNVNWINSLKFRATYGYSGNSANNYVGLPTIIYSFFPAVITGLNYAFVGNAPNPNLKWEEVRMTNLGIDFSILKDRIFGNFEVYKKVSEDLIAQIPLSPSIGTPAAPVNSASLKGSGFDLNINAKIIDKPINWLVGFNLSYSRVKVTKIFLPYLYTATDFLKFGINPAVGQLAYGISSFKWAGLDPENGDPRGMLGGKITKDYTSISNDTLNNQVFHGSAIPLFNGNMMNTITWKQFSASFNISFRFKYYYRKPSLNYESLFSVWSGLNEFSERWEKPGDEVFTNVPSMIYPTPPELTGRDYFYQNSEINVLRGDHVRLQDIRLQYTPVRKSSVALRQLSFFVYFNNLNMLLWTKDKSNYDPDFAGTIDFVIPPSKTVTLGLNMSF